MSNYPPGSEHDPNAPFNFDEAKWTKWEFHKFSFCKKCDECCAVDENKDCEDCFESKEIED